MTSVLLAAALLALAAVLAFLVALWRLSGREREEMRETAERLSGACPPGCKVCRDRFRLVKGARG